MSLGLGSAERRRSGERCVGSGPVEAGTNDDHEEKSNVSFDLETYLRNRSRRARASAAVLCTVIATFALAGRSTSEPIPITVSVGVRDPIYTHLYVALSKDFLKNEGLAPKVVLTGSGSHSAQPRATG